MWIERKYEPNNFKRKILDKLVMVKMCMYHKL